MAGKKQRLLLMFSMTFAFMLTELIVGYCGDSMALVADSFHMLSDVIALVVAFVSILLSPRPWKQSTFGWARAEVLGALINAVFLFALCVTIVVESCKRFIHPELISEPKWILCVGICGLIINLIGLLIFRGHAHSHGAGSSHSHGQGRKKSIPTSVQPVKPTDDDSADVPIQVIAERVPDILPSKIDGICSTAICRENERDANAANTRSPTEQLNSSQMNMRGVFLHVLADAMGSIAVIISASIVWATEEARSHDGDEFWRSCIVYIDPVLSIIIVVLILVSTWPLLYQASMILLQAMPPQIKLDDLRRQLVEEVPGIVSVVEFHVWQLTGAKMIASVHLRCENLTDYIPITLQTQEFFRRHGINSTTIQAEFNDNSTKPSEEHSMDCSSESGTDTTLTL